MKTTDLFMSPHAAWRLPAATCAAAAALALAGCAGPKDQYAASTDAQQRMAAEAAADTRAGANVDTQATYLKLVEQMQKEDLWFASLAHIDALEQRWGVTPESTRTRAEALRQTGQAAAAEATYKRLLSTPLASAGYRGLGLLAGARGNYSEAVQLLVQAQRRTPTDALLLSDLGYAYLGAGQVQEARLPLMQALQLRPDSTQALANLALYLEVTNQRDQAAALMEANRMPQPTRLAVREAALQMRASGRLPAPAAGTAPEARGEPVVVPLALKPSRWAGAGGVRTASQTNPSASTPEAPLHLNSTARGTP
jgi:Flp pilus assembly protein TadD